MNIFKLVEINDGTEIGIRLHSMTDFKAACEIDNARREFKIGVTAYNEWIVASEFEMRLLDLRGADLTHAFACLDGAGQRDEVRSGMFDERFADLFAIAG